MAKKWYQQKFQTSKNQRLFVKLVKIVQFLFTAIDMDKLGNDEDILVFAPTPTPKSSPG